MTTIGEFMELDQIRISIDEIDGEILTLFERRMKLCGDVADYKSKNGLPVFQGEREKQVLDKITQKSPKELEAATKLLFSQIMEISKCLQQEKLTQPRTSATSKLKDTPKIACPGIKGSYTEEACLKLFGCCDIDYFDSFGEVFGAVEENRADYGILPIENSTAGDVSETYDLLEKQKMYICGRVTIPVRHVLAAKEETGEITCVLSHQQALHQCAGFIKSKGYAKKKALNTSIAARTVSESGEKGLACICSAHCAELYGLKVIARDIADSSENFTRFIVISKQPQIDPESDTTSICLSLSNTEGSLYKMLTKFLYCGLNLTKIESRPMPAHIKEKSGITGFEVIFYLDFEGSILDPSISRLLTNLEKECGFFRFLGSYRDLD
ncbi:MAG: chorismate mutase [Firmicutes bacterium]|nr:chorismate mutase [[Eubacterium] siraeum]MCM1489026.1 chorismate mutase [Bacillota bacterium]